MAITQKLSIAFFSMEMQKEQIVMRLLSSQSMVSFYKIRRWSLSAEEQERVFTAFDNISSANIYIDDSSSITVFDIRSRLRRLISEVPVQAVFIDYIQIIDHPSFKDNRQQQIAEISRSLKSLAKELSIPVIAISQLNRKIEVRGKEERKPMLSDLKESGALEQDADLIIFLHREDFYHGDKTPPEKKGKADIIIGKNRNGMQGNFELGFDGTYFKVFSIDEVRSGEMSD